MSIKKSKESDENRNNLVLDTFDETDKILDDDPKPLIPYRFVMVILCTSASFLMFALRSNLSVAIVEMVNQTYIDAEDDDNSSYDDDKRCPIEDDTRRTPRIFPHTSNGEFNWNQNIQGLILGSYFYGYACTQILGGRLAERFGGKMPLTLGMMVTIIGTLLTPIAAELGVEFLVFVRAVIGIFSGFLFSSIFTLYSRWIPKEERVTALALMSSGAYIGSAVVLPVTAYLCKSSIANGWPSSFYIPGAFSAVWLIFWIILGSDSAEDNRFVSKYELKHVQKGIGDAPKKIKKVPWKAMFTSAGLWGAVMTKFCGSFAYLLLASKLPDYLNGVLRMDLTKNGFVNAFVSVAITMGSLISGPLSDFIRRKDLISITKNRKLFQTIALLGPSVGLALIPIVGCNENLVIIILLTSTLLYGFISGGETPIYADMAPAISGTAYGIANTLASTVGFIAPQLTGLILGDNQGKHEWSIVFYVFSCVTFIGILFFDIFATAEPQPWGVFTNTDDHHIENKINLNVKEKNSNE